MQLNQSKSKSIVYLQSTFLVLFCFVFCFFAQNAHYLQENKAIYSTGSLHQSTAILRHHPHWEWWFFLARCSCNREYYHLRNTFLNRRDVQRIIIGCSNSSETRISLTSYIYGHVKVNYWETNLEVDI